MATKQRLWLALAAAPALAALVAAPSAVVAGSKNHVKCEVTTKHGKTETKRVATAEDCTAMGGKVVTAKTKKY